MVRLMMLEENDEGVEATDPDPVPLPLPVPDPLRLIDPNAGVLVANSPPPISVGVPWGTLMGVAVNNGLQCSQMAVRVDMSRVQVAPPIARGCCSGKYR